MRYAPKNGGREGEGIPPILGCREMKAIWDAISGRDFELPAPCVASFFPCCWDYEEDLPTRSRRP